MVRVLLGDDSNFQLGSLFLGVGRGGLVLILYGTFDKLRDVSEDYNQPSCNSFLSCDYVNFKEKRSLTSYIQQFTLQCFSLTCNTVQVD